MRVEDHFLNLNKEFEKIIKYTFEVDTESRISNTFFFVDGLMKLNSVLDRRADTTILASAIQEYQFGCQAAVCGQYRYAFIAQRYFLEQICRFIYLSTNELHLRHWKLGLRDISWGSLIDNESGIFSKVFIRAFYPDVEDEGLHMLSIASKLYRESSEFVHGNFEKITCMPNNIEFNKDILSKWLDLMESSKLITLFLLFMRFSNDFTKEEYSSLQEIAQDELRNIDSFNKLFI